MSTYADLLDQIRTAATAAGMDLAYADAAIASSNIFRADGDGDAFDERTDRADRAYHERVRRGGFVSVAPEPYDERARAAARRALADELAPAMDARGRADMGDLLRDVGSRARAGLDG